LISFDFFDGAFIARSPRSGANEVRIGPVRHKSAAVPPDPPAGTSVRGRRWPNKSGVAEVDMSDNGAPNGRLGALLGALLAVALAVFLLNGGEHLGKKTVNSDADMPPIAQGVGK